MQDQNMFQTPHLPSGQVVNHMIRAFFRKFLWDKISLKNAYIRLLVSVLLFVGIWKIGLGVVPFAISMILIYSILLLLVVRLAKRAKDTTTYYIPANGVLGRVDAILYRLKPELVPYGIGALVVLGVVVLISSILLFTLLTLWIPTILLGIVAACAVGRIIFLKKDTNKYCGMIAAMFPKFGNNGENDPSVPNYRRDDPYNAFNQPPTNTTPGGYTPPTSVDSGSEYGGYKGKSSDQR